MRIHFSLFGTRLGPTKQCFIPWCVSLSLYLLFQVFAPIVSMFDSIYFVLILSFPSQNTGYCFSLFSFHWIWAAKYFRLCLKGLENDGADTSQILSSILSIITLHLISFVLHLLFTCIKIFSPSFALRALAFKSCQIKYVDID